MLYIRRFFAVGRRPLSFSTFNYGSDGLARHSCRRGELATLALEDRMLLASLALARVTGTQSQEASLYGLLLTPDSGQVPDYGVKGPVDLPAAQRHLALVSDRTLKSRLYVNLHLELAL